MENIFILNDIENNSDSWIGLDFGTCNSVVSEFANGKPSAVKLAGNSVIIPTAVLFNGPGDYRYGSDAIGRGIMHAESLATVFKTHIADENYKYTIRYANKNSEEKEERSYDNTVFIIDTDSFYSNEYILDVFNDESFSGKAFIPDCVVDELRESSLKNELSGRALTAIDNIEKLKATEKYTELTGLNATDEESTLTEKELLYYNLMKQNDCILVSSDSIVRSDLIDQCSEFEERIWNTEEFVLNVKPKSRDSEGYIEVTAFEAAVSFIRNIRKLASEYKKTSVSNVVVTVPVSFDITEIEAVKRACTAAGFSRVETELEPNAAGIRYFYQNQFEETRHILVYDFGGGTFDTTIIEIKPDSNSVFGAEYNIIGKSGDHHLGGDDITKLIEKEVFDNLLSDYDIDMNSINDSGFSKEDYAKNKNMIYKSCEECKIALSGEIMEEYLISLNLKKGDEIIEYSLNFENQKFENLIQMNILGRVEEKLVEVLETNYLSLDKTQIDDIILVGGTSSINILQRHLKDFFGKDPLIIGNLATLVSEGAAMETVVYSKNGGLADPEKIKLVNTNTLQTFGLGLSDYHYDVLVEKNIELPFETSKKYAISKNNPKEIEFSVFSTSANEIPESILCKDVEHVATIKITDLPEGLMQNDTFVNVSFKMNKDYTMSVDASLINKDDLPINEGKTVRSEIKSVR